MATSNLPTFFQHSAVTVVDELLDFELGGLEDEEEETQDLQDPAAGVGIDDEFDDQNDDTFANDDLMGIDGEIALPSFFQSTSTGERNDSLEMDDRIQMSVGSANSSSSAIGKNDLDITSLLKGLTWGGQEAKNVVPTVNASTTPTLPPGAKVLTEAEIAAMMGRSKPSATVVPTPTPSSQPTSVPLPMNYSSAARGITANKPTEQQNIEPSSSNNNNNNGSSNIAIDHARDNNNNRPQPFPFPLEQASFPRGPPFGPGWNNGPYGPYGPNGPPMGPGPGFYGPGGGMGPPGMMVMGPRGPMPAAMHMQQQQMHQQQMQQQMQAMSGGYPPFGPQGLPGNPNATFGRPGGPPMYPDQRPPQPPNNPPGTNMNNQGPGQGPEKGSSSGGGASNNASGVGASGMDPRLRTVGGSQLSAPAPGSGPGPQGARGASGPGPAFMGQGLGPQGFHAPGPGLYPAVRPMGGEGQGSGGMGMGGPMMGGQGMPMAPAVRYPHSEMMTSSDIKFVLTKVMQPLETNDPYSADYYYLQKNYKKNVSVREEAMSTGVPVPAPIYLPFPAWMDTKNRIAMQLEENRKVVTERSRQWEEKEQVLGHMQRTDISRPKELLSVPNWQDIQDMQDNDLDGMDGSSFRMPFVSRLWNMRHAVQRGYEALYTLQELNHLLLSPLVAGNPMVVEEVRLQIDRAVAALSQSIGIRLPAVMPGSSLGDNTDATAAQAINSLRGNTSSSASGSGEIALEGGLVAAILQTAKGKKLMSRSINLLPPEQRWALLPVVLARVLQTDSAEQPAEEQAVEQKLMKTLVQFVQHSREFQQSKQMRNPLDNSTVTFTTQLLGHLRQCVKSVMVSQMEKSKLRGALLSSRSRAEVMHVIVQVGDQVATDAEATVSADWASMREAFMSMLDG